MTTAEQAYQEWIAEFLETIGKPDNWDDANCNERWLVETAWAQAWPVARKPLIAHIEELEPERDALKEKLGIWASEALIRQAEVRDLKAELEKARELPDGVLLRLYELWSEERWAASFMSPMDDVVEGFVRWLQTEREVTEDYEREMLTKARAFLEGSK